MHLSDAIEMCACYSSVRPSPTQKINLINAGDIGRLPEEFS
jgi:hypothetical protein